MISVLEVTIDTALVGGGHLYLVPPFSVLSGLQLSTDIIREANITNMAGIYDYLSFITLSRYKAISVTTGLTNYGSISHL